MATLDTECRPNKCCLEYCNGVTNSFHNVGKWTSESINKIITTITDFFKQIVNFCSNTTQRSFHNVGSWLNDLIKKTTAAIAPHFTSSHNKRAHKQEPHTVAPHTQASSADKKPRPSILNKRDIPTRPRITNLERLVKYMEQRYKEKAFTSAQYSSSSPSLRTFRDLEMPPEKTGPNAHRQPNMQTRSLQHSASTSTLTLHPMDKKDKPQRVKGGRLNTLKTPIRYLFKDTIRVDENLLKDLNIFCTHSLGHLLWFQLQENTPPAVIKLLGELSANYCSCTVDEDKRIREHKIMQLQTFYRLGYFLSLLPSYKPGNAAAAEAQLVFLTLNEDIQNQLTIDNTESDVLLSGHIPEDITSRAAKIITDLNLN